MVTVAIPFYNAERYLKAAIDSVVNQTYKDWHLILIDDGSTDGSLAIAREFEKSDRRIKVYSDGKNKNLGYRLNEIPELVTTPFLARMDADDVMHPQRIEKQIITLGENPDIDVLGTNAYTIDENANVIGLKRKLSKRVDIQEVKSFIHPTIMAKTDWFKSNPYDVKAVRLEDFELWSRTNEKYNFQMLMEPLLFYREFSNGYYKKYLKSYSTIFYIIKKNKNHRLLIDIVTIPLRAFVYFMMENIFGSDIMFRRRNEVNFIKAKTIKQVINEKF